jgi:DNA polymerase III subunit delta
MTKSSSNVFLFFGEDDFSIRQKLDHWKAEFAKKYSRDSIVQLDATEIVETDLFKRLGEVFAPSLFSSQKLIVVKDIFPTKATQEILGDKLLDLINSLSQDHFLIFWQTKKPDRRLSITKKLLKSKIETKEFTLPSGTMLNAWIKVQASEMNVTIDEDAVEKLAVYVGRDLFEEKKIGARVIERKEAFNLWQVHSELSKLVSSSDHIKVNDVESLVQPKFSENVFLLSDEINRKNKKKALKILEILLDNQNLDEKSAIIKILGLLAEQVRSLILVGTLAANKLSQGEIAEKLGWSSGRVFITLKHVGNADLIKLKNLLSQLVNIDEQLKSSDANPKLLIDLFITQAAA